MLRIIFLSAMMVFAMASTQAQCLPGDLFLINQQQVDEFVSECPDVSVIYGSLVIGDTLSDIINLEGLKGITDIKGAISIQKNEQLLSLEGLQGITSIGESISILANKKLESIIDFPFLTKVNEDLFIVNNSNLKSIDGFKHVEDIKGDIILLGNSMLENMDGLIGIDHVTGSVRIHDNSSLQTLQGIDSIKYIGEDLTINYNDALVSFEGLRGLDNIGRDLVITFNPALKDLNALHGLNSIGRDLYIDSNETLEDCVELCDLLNYQEIGGEISIGGNAAGCTNSSIFLPVCAALGAESPAFEVIHSSPNPVHSILSLDLPENQPVLSVQLVSLAGKSIPLDLRPNNKLDVSSLSRGMYYLIVRTNNRLYHQKIVVN